MGAKYHNKIASAQALGQKNTILAIWLAQTFFSPLVVVAPATYVVWQNLVNSFQLSLRNKKREQ
jgi:BASS family bile acid:Na+ symporter